MVGVVGVVGVGGVVGVVGVVGALSVTFGDSSPRGRAKSVGGGDSDEDADSSRTHKERAFGRPGG